MSSGYAGPPSPTLPVLCHGPWQRTGRGHDCSCPLPCPSCPLPWFIGRPASSLWSRKKTQDNLHKEVEHRVRVLKQNGYPATFICNASALPTQETADTSNPDEGQEEEKGPLVVISYAAGMSEDIRCVCRKFNIRVVFKSGQTLCSMLTKVKDILPLGKQSNVVYRIPCSCSQVYIGETKRRLER